MESKGPAARENQTNCAETVEAAQENQTSNEFITCFHQFVSRIFSRIFLSLAVVKESKLLIGPKQGFFPSVSQGFFPSVSQLKKNHNKYSLKN